MDRSKRGAHEGATDPRRLHLGPIWVAALMALWGFAMIVPAALPH